MVRKRSLSAIGLVVVFGVAAWASIIHDPDMGIEAGSLSDPIAIGTTLIPINGGGTFGFFNPGRDFILSLAFQVFITPGLDRDTVEDAFHCQEDNPFFLGCFINYVPKTGVLTIEFSGTKRADVDKEPDDEAGEQEGIPPLLPGCINHPNKEGCDDVGHFLITLNDDFEDEGAKGGWSRRVNPDLFPSPKVKIKTTEIGSGEGKEEEEVTRAVTQAEAPEPSSAVPVVTAFLGGIVMALIRRRASVSKAAAASCSAALPDPRSVRCS